MEHGLESAPDLEPVDSVIERALDAYGGLADLGEQVGDEWQYVTDLVAVHTADLRAIAAADPVRMLRPNVIVAVDLAIEEIGLITDPHRAIDWLSTFPQIIRVALTVENAGPATAPATGARSVGDA